MIFDRPGTGFYYDGSYRGSGNSYSGQHLMSMFLVNPSSGEAYKDGVQLASGLTYNQRAISVDTAIGANYTGGGNQITGKLQEFIIFDSDKRTDRADIESNINSHYSVF